MARSCRTCVCTLLVLGCTLLLSGQADSSSVSNDNESKPKKWDKELQEMYETVMTIRSKRGLSEREKETCVNDLLVPAAGVRTASRAYAQQQQQQQQQEKRVADDGSSTPDDDSSASAAMEQGAATLVPGYPELEISPRAHKGAVRELAKVLMEGWGCEPDAQLALELFRHAAALGDPEAQGQMGVRYTLGLQHSSSWDALGILSFGEPDEDQALLHLYFGAWGGDVLSRMALGYDHLYGLSVPKSCNTAASYYLPVAEEVADLAAQPEGPGLPHIERIRLNVHHLQGAKADRQREVVQYYQDSADKGNVDAQTAVGQVLNYGTHGVERDHEAAMSYLQRAADAGDSQAMAHLANMLANGLGGDAPDYGAAFKLFQSAAQQGNPSAQYGLGYMYLVGQGVAQDHQEAFNMFSQAAAQGHADAHFYMGVMHLRGLGGRRRNLQRAFTCFTLAGHAGNVQAMYNAALLHLAGKGTPKSCKAAVSLLKSAAERGPAAAALQLGHEAFFRGHYNSAVWQYLQAAVAGMELGMSNAAWLLSQGYTRAGGNVHNVTFSLQQRSAAQGNIASLLAMGDAYFYGKGVEQEWSRAAAIYYEAYQERSAEAMFNLGFMHEFGAGVPKDLLLARRFYDMAKHTTSEASLAVHCARAWLVLHRAWDSLRPHLPQAYSHLWDHMWSLQPPHTSVLGSWTAVVGHLLPSQAVMQLELGVWQWLDALGLTSLMSAVSETTDLGETAVMLMLFLLLFVVLRLRRQRVALHQQQQQQQQQQQVLGGAAAAAFQAAEVGLGQDPAAARGLAAAVAAAAAQQHVLSTAGAPSQAQRPTAEGQGPPSVLPGGLGAGAAGSSSGDHGSTNGVLRQSGHQDETGAGGLGRAEGSGSGQAGSSGANDR